MTTLEKNEIQILMKILNESVSATGIKDMAMVLQIYKKLAAMAHELEPKKEEAKK